MFVDWADLSEKQRAAVRERRGGTPDNALERFAFWIKPDGEVSRGMVSLPRHPAMYKSAPAE